MKVTLPKLFAAAFLAGAALVAVLLMLPSRRVPVRSLTNGVFVSAQLESGAVDKIARRGFASIIDLRPDGEAPDQPSSEMVRNDADRVGLKFAYVPVQHGDIPKQTVDALAKALQDLPKPVLMYCRSGRRAARTWALVEASRPGGLSQQQIQAAVAGVGQTADDLSDEIARGEAARGSATPAVKP